MPNRIWESTMYVPPYPGRTSTAAGVAVRADVGVTKSGANAVSQWVPYTGTGTFVQPTAVNQPLFVAASGTNRDAIRTDGVNDFVYVSPSPATAQAGSTGLTVMFVVRGNATNTGDYPGVVSFRPWGGAADSGWAISANGTGMGGLVTTHFANGANGWDHTNAAAGATVGISKTKKEVWAVVFDYTAKRLRFYINGALNVERAPPFPTSVPISASPLIIGGDRLVGTRYFGGDFYNVAIFQSAMTASSVAALSANWQSVYGVPS